MGGFADRLAARRCETGSASPVRLMTLPMTDIEDNALMVNAIQRRATVVVQKSWKKGLGSPWPSPCGNHALSWRLP